MRLQVKQPSSTVHTELCAAVGFNVWNELFSCSDDQTIHKWNLVGEAEGKVRSGETRFQGGGSRSGGDVRDLGPLASPSRPQACSLDAYFTDLHWYPVSSKKNQAGGTDVFAVACTDGEAPCPGSSGECALEHPGGRGARRGRCERPQGPSRSSRGLGGRRRAWRRTGGRASRCGGATTVGAPARCCRPMRDRCH
jgi:intraflagellar transport protein 80